MNDFKQIRRRPKADFAVTIDKKDKVTSISDNEPTNFEKQDKTMSKKKTGRFAFLRKLSKKQKIIVSSLGLLLIIVGVGLVVFGHHPAKTTKLNAVKARPLKSTTASKPAVITSPLSGLPVTLAQSQLPVTAIMIENSDAARPQSGLSQAGVVFEALAEGGITRFVALFQEGQPSSIGPIRSARPYFIDWMLPFDASYVHVGGSPDALSQITTDAVKDVDQFYNAGSFIRIASREAPHNVYTSMSALLSLEQSKGYATSKFTGLPRKADSPAATPTATKIDFNVGGPDVEVHYDYDAKNNAYLRSEAGAPMIDANTNLQLEPKVVIGLVVPLSEGALDASGAYYSDYSDIGSGQAVVFQDGSVTVGTWTKTSSQSQITLTDSKGSPITLDAGQVWFTAVSASNLITYSN